VRSARNPPSPPPPTPERNPRGGAAARHFRGNPVGVGRHGASDIVYFQRAGIPGVEFGPVGGGHHGPSEYVVTSTLEDYRRMIVEFVQIVGRNGKSRQE